MRENDAESLIVGPSMVALEHPWGLGRGRSVAKMIWDADANLARPKQECGLDYQSGLIVQEMLPPMGRNELGDDHGQVAALALPLHPVDVVQ